MWSKIILNLILIISLAIIQLSFISGLPAFLDNINLIIVAIILILVIGNFKLAFWWSIGTGIMLDIYSFLIFGVNLVSLLTTLLFANFLLVNFFTNRSLYSILALTILASICYDLLSYGLSCLIYFFSHQDFILNLGINFWLNRLSGLALNLLAVLIIFYFMNFISHKFKPVFLIRRKF